MPSVCCNKCPTKCPNKCYLDTQIVFDLSSCEGIFTFGPDILAVPGPCDLSGINQDICPLHVKILKNCKNEYQITLLDDNGCSLETLVLQCPQYKIIAIEELDESISPLYQTTPEKSHLFQINGLNLNLTNQYIQFEEAAYFYRQVKQNYLNLWCNNQNLPCQVLSTTKNFLDFIQPEIYLLDTDTSSPTDIYFFSGTVRYTINVDIGNSTFEVSGQNPIDLETADINTFIINSQGDFVVNAGNQAQFLDPIIVNFYFTFDPTLHIFLTITYTPIRNSAGALIAVEMKNELALYHELNPYAQFFYALTNDFFKSRVSSLKQLCDCGKVCNDQFFPTKQTPCSILKGCCRK